VEHVKGLVGGGRIESREGTRALRGARRVLCDAKVEIPALGKL